MSCSCLSLTKVTILTSVVVLSFVLSSLGWRHVESDQTTRILVAATILLSMYALMVFELVNRNLAAMIGAAASIAAYDCLVDHVKMEELVQWEDLETLALLFGMMIIVNVLALSGLFDFLAIWAYKKSAGRFYLLITIMSFLTAFLSAFIDNVSAMLLISPTLIKLAELEHLDPRYVLMIMVIFCNIGGCATPVGDPPNLIVIGDPLVSSLGITFGSFVVYCGPCVLLTIATILTYFKLVYKSKGSFRLMADATLAANDKNTETTSIQIMELNSGSTNGKDVIQLNRSLRRLSSVRLSEGTIKRMMTTHSIRNKTILAQSLAVLFVTVLLFFIQSLPGINLTLGWVSLFAGLTLLVMSSGARVEPDANVNAIEDDEREDVFELVISNIEWSTLMFFSSLFIVMEIMSKLGLISFIGHQIGALIGGLPTGSFRDIGAISIILWSSAVASACIDNVPFTSMMVKVLGALVVVNQSDAGPVIATNLTTFDIKPLVFALVFGACYGGNGTIIGASANLVTASVAGRHGYPISFNRFFKFAAVPTLISIVVSNLYLIVVFVVLKL